MAPAPTSCKAVCSFVLDWLRAGVLRIGRPGVLPGLLVALLTSTAFAVPDIGVRIGRTSLLGGQQVSFGSVREDRPLVRTLTVVNEGSDDLDVFRVLITGPFRVIGDPGGVLGPGERTAVRVELPSGTATGTATSVISIRSADPDETQFDLTLTATVTPVAPNISVLLGTEELSSGQDEAVSFGTIAQGRTASRTLTVRNTGNASLSFRGAEVSGSGFRVRSGAAATLRPGRRLTISVSMTGESAGEQTGELRLLSNDRDTPDFTVPLAGTVSAAATGVSLFSEGQLLRDGAMIDYGVTFDGFGVERLFTITNRSRGTVSIGEVEVSGEGFEVTRQPRSRLGRNGTTSFRVEMVGDAGATLAPSGTLRFPEAGEQLRGVEVGLSGQVLSPLPELAVFSGSRELVSGDTVEFTATAGASAGTLLTVTMRNQGGDVLDIPEIRLTGTGYALDTNPAPTFIDPLGRLSVRVRATSTLPTGEVGGVLTIVSGDEDEGLFTVNLKGSFTAAPPRVLIEVAEGATVISSGGTLNFGSPQSGECEQRTITIRHLNRLSMSDPAPPPLDVSAITLETTGSEYTFVTPPVNSLIPEGQSVQLQVRVRRTTGGIARATLSFCTNATNVTGPSGVCGSSRRFQAGLLTTYSQAVINARVTLDEEPGSVSEDRPAFLGAVTAGAPGEDRVFKVVNVGNDEFEVQSVEFAAATTAFEFRQRPTFPLVVPAPEPDAPPSSFEFALRMTGVGTGTVQSQVVITVKRKPCATVPAADETKVFRVALSGNVYNWTTVSGGITGNVNALLETRRVNIAGDGDQPYIYAAGDLTAANGAALTADAIVRRRVRANQMEAIPAWERLRGGGVSGAGRRINALTVFRDGNADRLVAGGVFDGANTTGTVVSARNVARWTGSSWEPMGAGVNGEVHALAVFDGQLYAGGSFSSDGTNTVPLGRIARWQAGRWQAVRDAGTQGVGVDGGDVFSMLVLGQRFGALEPGLYVGGSFVTAAGKQVNRFARWDGSEWSPQLTPSFGAAGLVAGLPQAGDAVRAMVEFDPDGGGERQPVIVLGGDITLGGPTPVNNIMMWDGSFFTRLGTDTDGVDGTVRALARLDLDGNEVGQPASLFVGGTFSNAGGLPASRIAQFTATGRWLPVGPGVTGGNVLALIPGADAARRLTVGGTFTNAGGMAALSIAAWGAVAP
ncbi:MAG: choice-of-anchor D domain-containing protein [Planctomycetota bacterium]|nr:choice-of-anchor D domain-containing protein [Planctomycetota bacterium]